MGCLAERGSTPAPASVSSVHLPIVAACRRTAKLAEGGATMGKIRHCPFCFYSASFRKQFYCAVLAQMVRRHASGIRLWGAGPADYAGMRRWQRRRRHRHSNIVIDRMRDLLFRIETERGRKKTTDRVAAILRAEACMRCVLNSDMASVDACCDKAAMFCQYFSTQINHHQLMLPAMQVFVQIRSSRCCAAKNVAITCPQTTTPTRL